MLMKLQRYSISTDHTTVTCVQSNMYLAWMFHTARSVTDWSCLVCHYRINAPHLMLPLEDLAECLAEAYAENFLCPTICLLGALSASYGPECMYNLSSSGAFHPVHTPDSRTVPVHADILLSFPVCLRSPYGIYPVGDLANCIVLLYVDVLNITTHSSCNSSTNYSCTNTESVVISLPDFGEDTLPLTNVFWYCGDDLVHQTLPVEWQDCCAPVRLDGKTRVLLLSDAPSGYPSRRARAKRDAALWTQYVLDESSMNYSDWASDETVHLHFGGTPVGVPDRLAAMEAIGGGFASILFPAVQINRNTAWINYIWYNQQRFINYSIGLLGLIHDRNYMPLPLWPLGTDSFSISCVLLMGCVVDKNVIK